MRDFNLLEPELLKTVLQPLLKNFEYWFARSRTLLETERLSFLDKQDQSDLLMRVKLEPDEVKAANMLFRVAEGKVGINMATLRSWHKLITVGLECCDAIPL